MFVTLKKETHYVLANHSNEQMKNFCDHISGWMKLRKTVKRDKLKCKFARIYW